MTESTTLATQQAQHTRARNAAPLPSNRPDDGADALHAGALQLGLTLDPSQHALFDNYRSLMLAANKQVNLTAITDPTAVMTRHFLDSLTIALALSTEERAQTRRVIDVGSGAGLPGLALAIAFPQWQMTLLESIGKKSAFLRRACTELGLEDRVVVVTGRAEDIAHDPRRRAAYDVAVARAVAGLATLAEYLLPFCRVGGRMVTLKKGDLAVEIAASERAVSLLGGTRLVALPVPPLADLGADRVVLVSTKRQATPATYPRRPGLPAKAPLGGDVHLPHAERTSPPNK